MVAFTQLVPATQVFASRRWCLKSSASTKAKRRKRATIKRIINDYNILNLIVISVEHELFKIIKTKEFIEPSSHKGVFQINQFFMNP